MKHIYKRYGGDVSKVDELLIKADTTSKFAQLILRLSARFPTLLSDRRPPPEPKAKKAPSKPPVVEEEPSVVEEEAVADAVEEEEAGEEDVIDLDAGEL